MEKILKIERTSFSKNETPFDNDLLFDGYEIVTDKQTIKIGIDNSQRCCENFGCLITNDDIKDFIGSELKSLAIVDEVFNKKELEELKDLDCGGAMFVNLETSEGLLQFVSYNSQNGAYEHEAVLISKQLTKEIEL